MQMIPPRVVAALQPWARISERLRRKSVVRISERLRRKSAAHATLLLRMFKVNQYLFLRLFASKRLGVALLFTAFSR
jgi:hypothetical protein